MKVPVHGAVWGEAERAALHAVVESGWYTHGPECAAFERALEKYTGKRFAILCNSGSSANLLAITALGLWPGGEVITAAVGFPTTLNPIIQNNLIPVLVDVGLPSLVPTAQTVELAVDPEKTKAVFLAATLGHPLPVKELRQMCEKRGLFLLVDCCDGLGTPGLMEHADIATLSFFPAHQIAAGEGGAVLTDNPRLAKIITSLRDWGRACWCLPGQDDTCRKRFAGAYDHKYTYERIGYNLKATEFTGALGRVQMERIHEFVKARAWIHRILFNELLSRLHGEHFILPDDSLMDDVSWFGFSLICQPHIDRADVMRFLESRGVQTRVIFGGNLIRQPAYQETVMRIAEPLINADIIHERAFFVGCWPGLEKEQIEHIVNSLVEYTEGR